jgi:hypothetical protein
MPALGPLLRAAIAIIIKSLFGKQPCNCAPQHLGAIQAPEPLNHRSTLSRGGLLGKRGLFSSLLSPDDENALAD